MGKGWIVLFGSVAGVAMAVPAHAQAQRNYDCSKPGNANKAVCKAKAAGTTGPAAAPTPAATPAVKTRNYDCSKAGNANKAVCKAAASAAPAPSAPAAAPAPAPTVAKTSPAAPRTATGQNTNPGGPNGATAKCRDGTMSFSQHRSGTCSRHGGVAQWY